MLNRTEVLADYFETIDRHDANRENNREFMNFLGFADGLTIIVVPDFDEMYDDLIDAGYEACEAAKAVRSERFKLGLS